MLSKKTLGILAVIILALVIILAVVKSRKNNDSGNENANTPAPVTKTEVPKNQLPNKFPDNIPIESGAEVVDNYNASTTDGRYQATRTFVTEGSLAGNLKLYSDYLKDNGWTTQAVVDQSTYKMVVGMKDKQQLQIAIDENSSSKVKTVTISLTEVQ